MQRFLGALLVQLEQDDTFTLQALGDADQRGLYQLRLICLSNFTHDVRGNGSTFLSACCYLFISTGLCEADHLPVALDDQLQAWMPHHFMFA